MTTLDDLLSPLHQGVWEVAIPKESVTEPLGSDWETSAINLPTPGTIRSYRKGQYHMHETRAEWKVHLDRYDPKVHPFLHLVDDAPLVFMIGGTFLTLIMDSRSAMRKDIASRREEQDVAWQLLVAAGLGLMLIGVIIAFDPLIALEQCIPLGVRLGIIVIAVVILGKGIRLRLPRIVSRGRLLLGLGVLAVGIVSFFLSLAPLALIFIGVLTLWTFASAVVSIERTAKGRTAVPEGFYKRLAMGVASLAFAVLIVIAPVAAVVVLVILAGIFALLFGFIMVMSGVSLWKRKSFGDAGFGGRGN